MKIFNLDRLGKCPFAAWLTTFLMTFLLTFPVSAQRERTVPSPRHYETYKMIYRGHLGDAAKHSRDLLESATKIGSNRWLDSVCYYTLLGETYYIAGNLDTALENYESAIDLYLSSRDWLSRVTYPTGLTSSPPPAVPWGRGNRNFPMGVFPKNALIKIGDPITDKRLQQGGIMKNPEMHPIEPEEILRCMALAMRRRNQILGALAPYDPRCQPLLEAFSTRSVSPNHWSVVLQDVLFGIALEGGGKEEEAIKMLEKSLLISGESDHFLTASALLTLGDIYLKTNRPFEAADSYYEASVSAFAYGDLLLVEEAVRKYAGTFRALNQENGRFAYANGMKWASDYVKSPFLFLSMSLCQAEDLIIAKEDREGVSLLKTAGNFIKNQGLEQSRYADLYHYLNGTALIRYGHLKEGEEELAAMTVGIRSHSERFFQMNRLNNTAESLTPRAASDLYEDYASHPEAVDWACDAPLALAIETYPFDRELENLFLLYISRDLKDKAFETAERIRTKRFLNTFEWGGRTFSLRYLLSAPMDCLSDQERSLRQNILLDYPEYTELTKQADELQAQLKNLPLVPEEKERNEQAILYQQIQETEIHQETILKGMALGRMSIPNLFPPQEETAEIQEKLPEETSILAFFQTSHEVYGFLITKTVLDAWPIGPVGGLTNEIAAFLKDCGATDASKAKTAKELFSESWKEDGYNLLGRIMGDPKSGDPRFSVQFKSLTIVPDGVFWNLPFDALSLPKGNELVPLIASPELTVRYAPTVSMAFAKNSEPQENPFAKTAILTGKLHPKESEEKQGEVLARFERIFPQTTVLTPKETGYFNHLGAAQTDRLLVLHEIPSKGADWSPFVLDAKSLKDSILTWAYLPWGAPRVAALPGFRSAAENGMKDGGNGEEFFVPLLILQAQGTETVLISRWRPGGASTYELLESFLSDLKENPPADAWKNAVLKFWASPLSLKDEPRFKGFPPKTEPQGDAPFFWAGLMLVDRGIIPASLSPDADEAADGNLDESSSEQNGEKSEKPATESTDNKMADNELGEEDSNLSPSDSRENLQDVHKSPTLEESKESNADQGSEAGEKESKESDFPLDDDFKESPKNAE